MSGKPGRYLEDYFEFETFKIPKHGSCESIRIKGTRASLECVVEAYASGISPEDIVENLPSLTLEKVFAALAYYERNRPIIDELIRRQKKSARFFTRRTGKLGRRGK